MNEYMWLIPFVLSVVALGCSFSTRKALAQGRLSMMPEYKVGWQSHLMGKFITENPYDVDTDSFKSWKLGWENRETNWRESKTKEENW